MTVKESLFPRKQGRCGQNLGGVVARHKKQGTTLFTAFILHRNVDPRSVTKRKKGTVYLGSEIHIGISEVIKCGRKRTILMCKLSPQAKA